jgi:hypothetical protein
MRKLAALLTIGLAFAACGSPRPDPETPVAQEGGLVVEFQQVRLLEAVGPTGEPVPYEDGSRAVVIDYAVVNEDATPVAVADLPVVQLFDGQGGAWSADMQFVPSASGEMTNEWPTEVAAGATLRASAVFTIAADSWDQPGWAAGWRGSAAGERTPLTPDMTPVTAD